MQNVILVKCLSDPENDPGIVRSNRKHILRSDFQLLLSSSTDRRGSSAAAAQIANLSSWRRLWDTALDQGVKGTRIMLQLYSGNSVGQPHASSALSVKQWCLPAARVWNMRAYTIRLKWRINYLISLLSDADPAIFSSCKRVSYSSCFWTLKYSN